MSNGKAPGVAWVIGASSGVGAATARALAERGFRVAVSGRREDNLRTLTTSIREALPGATLATHALDITDPGAALETHRRIAAELGDVTCLIYAAGLNAPKRYLADMDHMETAAIFATNAVAPSQVTQLVLPGMRSAEGGTIIYISSIAAWRHAPAAGVAYSASKKAMSTLAEHVNSTESVHGIRATSILPGDIDTEFLSMRPEVPDSAARRSMLTAEDVAATVAMVVDLPAHVCIDELVVTPVKRDQAT